VLLSNIPPALTGEPLLEQIHKAKEQRKALVDGFLYEKTILMVAASPGLGKSTLSTQVAIELAAGLPVFGAFPVIKPLKVLYCQNERPQLEFLERAEVISKTYPIVAENLTITDSYKLFNLLKEDHLHAFIKCVMRDCPGVEVIFLDPIYPLVSGGLSKDEPASAFVKAMSLLQHFTGATLYLNHHTTKPTHDMDGRQIEKDDPYYGSSWLKACVTGSYAMKETKGGVSLHLKKDNYSCLHKTIHLEYDGSTELSHVPNDQLPVGDKLKSFLKLKEVDKKEFGFNDIRDAIGCDIRTLRKQLARKEIFDTLDVTSTKKNKSVYKVKVVL
jgi:RecA-family ATPase